MIPFERPKTCKCGAKLEREKFYDVVYYDPNNRQQWKSIGHSKRAAEKFDYEAKIAKNEGRYIKQAPAARTTFQTLAHWYLELPEVMAKRSYDRDKQSLDHLLPFLAKNCSKKSPRPWSRHTAKPGWPSPPAHPTNLNQTGNGKP